MLDLLFSCKVKDQDAYIRVVLEHKSYLDKELPIQLSYYNSAIWEEAIKEKEYYPPIINIVFYHGKGEWNIPTSLPVLEGQNLEKYVSKLNYILIDLNKVSDDELIKEAYIDFCFTSAVIAMKHVHENIEKIKAVFRPLVEYVQIHEDEEGYHCLFFSFNYISYVKGDTKEAENALKELIGGYKKAMTLIEKWIMEGKQEGLQEGSLKTKKDDVKSAILIKFKVLPKELEEKIESTDDIQTLDEMFKKVILANKIEEIL